VGKKTEILNVTAVGLYLYRWTSATTDFHHSKKF